MVYADNAATTKMSRTAIDAMLPYMETHYGNPSSLYRLGQEAAEALQSARETVAACLGCTPREITFTSGGSEADNQALISAARIGERKGKKHIISTAFEHHAILHTLKKLEKEGFEVELLPVGPIGTVTAQQVADAIRPDTCLVTTMYANWVMGEVAAAVHAAEDMDYGDCPVKAQTLSQILTRLSDGTVNAKGAKKLFSLIWDGASDDVDTLIEKEGLKQISDAGAIEPIIDEILAKNGKMVEEFRSGKEKAFNALVGQAMKATRGKANPKQVNEILRKKLAL